MFIVPSAPLRLRGQEYVKWLEGQPPLFPLALKQSIIGELALKPRRTIHDLVVAINGPDATGMPYISRPTYVYREILRRGSVHTPDAVKLLSYGTMLPELDKLEDRGVVSMDYDPVPGDPQAVDRRVYSLRRGIGGIAVPIVGPDLPLPSIPI